MNDPWDWRNRTHSLPGFLPRTPSPSDKQLRINLHLARMRLNFAGGKDIDLIVAVGDIEDEMNRRGLKHG